MEQSFKSKSGKAAARVRAGAPRLTRRLGPDGGELRDRMSLHNLIAMSERLQDDAATLLDAVDEHEVPSLGVTAEITLKSAEEREAFSRDFLRAMHTLLEKYVNA